MSRIHYKKYSGIILLARNLRKHQTPSEVILWQILRRKNLFGYKFQRQHPIFYRIDKEWIEFFIADFYCSKLHLVIELDGKVHNDMKDYDSERDSKLLSKGIKVIRIKNEELSDVESVILFLKNEVIDQATQVIDNSHNTTPSLNV